MDAGDIKKDVKQFDCNLLAEEYRYEQFNKTANILKELDYAECKTLKPLYNY